MIDENLVTVVNSENPVINVEITAQNNNVDIEFVQSFESVLFVHNCDKNAHSDVLTLIKDDLNQDISTINARLISTYTKEESDDLLDDKLNIADSTVTKQGNAFNGASQLVQLNSNAQLPALDAGLLTNISGGGVNKFENKGTVTSAITLSADVITKAAFSGSVSITLPTVTNTTQQVTCILDFTTVSSAYPTIVNTNLKWSNQNSGKAPSAYSILSGVRNVLIFKAIWVNDALYWEAEYTTYGSVELAFSRPNLSANGTLGGTDFAVYASVVYSSYYTYYAVDGSTSTGWNASSAVGDYFVFYNPNALKLNNLGITLTGVGGATGLALYGSNDNSTYTFIQNITSLSVSGLNNISITSNTFYKYHKLIVTACSGRAGINELAIGATYIAT